MNKMNKKGFTLIEMLVVIAIIAVLVSIIVPVVGNSTKKAAAATNAANLRSAAATLAIAYLSDDDTMVVSTTADATYGNEITTFPTGFAAPTAKENGGCPGGTFKAFVKNGTINCYFVKDSTYSGVTEYATIAES